MARNKRFVVHPRFAVINEYSYGSEPVKIFKTKQEADEFAELLNTTFDDGVEKGEREAKTKTKETSDSF